MALPPPPPDAVLRPRIDPPGRVLVFLQVLWRSIVVAVVGGVVIGVGFVVVVSLFGESWNSFDGDGGGTDDGVLVAMLFATFFGAVFGTALGVLAGAVLGFVGAFVLVPYRGRRLTVLVVRVAAPLLVAAFFVALLGGDDRVWLLLGGAGMIGAAVAAPWLVAWYVRRMEPESA